MKILKNFGQFVNENFGQEYQMEEGMMSDCCGAQIVHGGHCSSCGEKCEESHGNHEEDEMNHDHMGHQTIEEDEDEEDEVDHMHAPMYEAKKKKMKEEEEEEEESEPMPKAKKKPTAPKSEKPNRKEVLKTAKEKFPNLKPDSMKKGLSNMKGKDFKAKTKKNFGWAESPSAAAAAYIRKATGKEPKDA
jgi:hypothetical protein